MSTKNDSSIKKIPWIKRKGSVSVLVGAILAGSILIMVVISLFWTPEDPNMINLRARFLKPFSAGHILGCDELGRDMLSRTMVGGQLSLAISLLSLIGTTTLGTVMGLLSGFYGGIVDDVTSMVAEIRNALPTMVLIVTVMSIFGSSITFMIIILSLVEWVQIFRTVRAKTIVEKNKTYVTAAICSGASNAHVVFKYIFPNIISDVIILATLMISTLVSTEASLSFIGIGVARPYPSWGRMISDGSDAFASAPWIAGFPALSIGIFVIGVNFIAEGIKKKIRMS